MAATILLVFSFYVLCYEVLSAPVLKLKSEDSDVVERTFDLTKKVLSPDKVTVEQNFEVPFTSGPSDVNSVERFGRVKRQVIVYHGCPEGTIWYARRCLPFEQYERLVKDDEDEE